MSMNPENPAYPCPIAVDEEMVLTGMIVATNEVGGSVVLDDETVRVKCSKVFWDHECGWRFHGELLDETDIARVRALTASPGLTEEHYREKYPNAPQLWESVAKARAAYNPAKVFFDEDSLPRAPSLRR